MTSQMSRRDVLKAMSGAVATVAGAGWIPGVAGAGRRRVVSYAVPERISERFASLPFEAQQIGGLLGERMRANVAGRLLQVPEETYLKGFIGRETGADKDGAWLGEHIGKYLEAACNALRYQHDDALETLVTRMARTLISTQGPDGYLGTYPRDKRWTSWDPWVHKYNLVGLLAWYEYSDDAAALTACRGMGDLLCRTFGEAPGQIDLITVGEHVGMASTSVLEPMCLLYRLTGEARYLDFCQYIVRSYDHPGGPRIVSALLEFDSVAQTANGKAYEMLSNFNGLVDLYRITGEQRLLDAVMRGWEDIVRTQRFVTGNMSAGEIFLPAGRLMTLQSSHVGETCVSVTWLQLNLRLLRLTGEARFGQEIERTLYNHLLAAQDVRSGDISYYTALVGPKHYRNEVLCCVSSGQRAIALIPQFAWGVEQGAFVVNLYTAGQVRFELGDVPVQVRSDTRFPADGDVLLTVNPQRATRFVVRLRVPEWATRFRAEVDGQTFAGTPGSLLEIDRTWQPSSRLQIRMELPVQVLSAGDLYPDYVALQRGPQVLALEKSLNPHVPYLHRVELGTQQAPVLSAVATPAGWAGGSQLYEMDADVGEAAGNDRLQRRRRTVRLVPFADAADCRVWLTRTGRMPMTVPAVTAFAKADVSEQKFLWDTEFLTDENASSYCTADPRNMRFSRYRGRAAGERGGPVWFSVVLDAPDTISRVAFRHGPVGHSGGWFDTSTGKPRVMVATAAQPSQDGYRPTQWEEAGTFEAYPETDAADPTALPEGRRFELRLPRPTKVYAIQLIGKTGGDFVSCAELSAYA